MKECVICNTEFESYKGIAKVCGETSRKIKKKNYDKSLGSRYKSRKRVVEKTCVCCGEVFNAYPNKLKYCSIECNRKQRRLNWEKENPLLARPCEYCKKDFTPKQRDGRFCSRTCVHKNWAKLPKNALNLKISRAIRHNLSGYRKNKDLEIVLFNLEYSLNELKEHLESKWDSDMSWSNYSHKGWHIDHIKPLASFSYEELTDPEVKVAWALENLQPLWAKDNLKKGAKEMEG
jgi:hypothetical protein